MSFLSLHVSIGILLFFKKIFSAANALPGAQQKYRRNTAAKGKTGKNE